MIIEKYDKFAAKMYAKKWAFSRNPKYYPFDIVGGDCTSFVSQCLYAGSKTMNYTPVTGWYYINSTQRSASWSGVEYLYKFLINNNGVGPFGKEVLRSEIEIGDIIQLGNYEKFYHSLLVVEKKRDAILVSAHNFDAYMKNLDMYIYERIRFIHILGVRKEGKNK